MADTNTIRLGRNSLNEKQWGIKESNLLAINTKTFTNYSDRLSPVDFDVTRATSAMRVNKEGDFELVDPNVPRIDFFNNDKGELLVEPERTNTRLRSTDFSFHNGLLTNMTKNVLNTSIIPGGKALEIRETNVSGFHRAQFTPDAVLVVGQVYTRTLYFKLTPNRFVMDLGDSGQTSAGVIYNFNTDTALSTGANIIDFSYERIKDDVIVAKTTFTATATIGRVSINFYKDNNTSSYLGDVNEGYDMYHVQYELGTTATSPIVTDNSQKTRNADVISYPGIDSITLDNDFTLMVDFYIPFDPVGAVINNTLLGSLTFETINTNRTLRWRYFNTNYRAGNGKGFLKGEHVIICYTRTSSGINMFYAGVKDYENVTQIPNTIDFIFNLNDFPFSEVQVLDYAISDAEAIVLTTPITEIIRVPKISGDAFIGVTLVISQFADWTTGLNGTVSGSYVWQSSTNGTSWSNILGTDNVPTYTIVQSDLNKYIRVNQTITDGTTTDIKGSDPTNIVRDLLTVVQSLSNAEGYTQLDSITQRNLTNEIL